MLHKLKNKVVAVTGGCGFIGSNLIKKLIELKVSKIIIIDDLTYGKLSNIPFNDHRIEMFNFCINHENRNQIESALIGVDFLFHLAAQKYNQSKNNPTVIVNSNINGIIQLCDCSLVAGVKRVVFSSSLYIYGIGSSLPYDEKQIPDPHTIYGMSKLAGEQILKQYHKKGLQYNILRYFFVYGPNQFSGTGYKSVILKNFERMLDGKSPIVFGDGSQILDYSYISDIIQGTLVSMVNERPNCILNLGSGNPTSIIELTLMMKKIAGYTGEILYEESDETAGTVRVGSIQKAKEILNYRPKISLYDGLRKTYEWLKDG